MGLADKLAFSMGAKLDGDSFDTVKEDKKKSVNQSKSSNEIIPKNQHQLVFTFEKRKGKPVTLVGRFNIKEDEKKEVLKQKLACGGAINEEWLELQGDVKEKIKIVLESDGWKFRK